MVKMCVLYKDKYGPVIAGLNKKKNVLVKSALLDDLKYFKYV